jgi:integrase
VRADAPPCDQTAGGAVSWVERCPNGRWRARYRDPTRRKRSQTFDTKAAAKTFLAGVTTDMVRGQWIDPRGGDVPVAEWAQRWLDARVVRATTLAGDRTRLRRHVLPAFGQLPLKALTPLTVRAWVARLSAAGLAPKTLRHCHALLSTLLADAVTEGLLLANPCQGTRLPAAQRYEARFLTAPEVDRLLAVLDPPERTLVLVAVSTGLRWGELSGLRRHRLDLLRGRLHVAETLVEVNGRVSFGPPKTPRSVRTVSLPRQAVDALAHHLVGHTGDLVFTSREGTPLRRHNFSRRVWKPAVAAAGLAPEPRFHDLRHTHVAMLIAAGVPMKAISERLGHTSIVITMDRYGHLQPDVDDALVRALEARLASAP